MRLADWRWEREALRGPATRVRWARGPGGLLARVTEAACPEASAELEREVERALEDAVARWGGEAVPAIAAMPGEDGRYRAGCIVRAGALTLEERLKRSPLDPDEALDRVMQVAERLGEWHERGVAHGYLRPETVLLDGESIRLLEPGLHAAAADVLARREVAFANDPYLAPEPGRFRPEALAADVFALGVLLVHLLLGRRPVWAGAGGIESSPLLEALPGPLQRTVAAALHVDPAQRLPGAQKLGLYLRVHRLWASSWDWSPLATLAAAADGAATVASPPPLTARSDPTGAAPANPAVEEAALPDGRAVAAPTRELPRRDVDWLALEEEADPPEPAGQFAAGTDAAPEPERGAPPAPPPPLSDWPAWMPRPLVRAQVAAAPPPSVPRAFEASLPATAGSPPARDRRIEPPSGELESASPSAARESPAGSGHLILEATIGGEREQFVVEGDRATVGRPDLAGGLLPDVPLRFDDAVSRRHAEIRRRAEGWVVVDVGSTNGTRLNGTWLEPHQEALLEEGDEIEMGSATRLVVRFAVRPAGE